MTKHLTLDRPILVEGKYDKIKLSSFVDSEIIVLDGFGIFNDIEKRQMLKRIAGKKGVIVLTDADGGGLVIRGHLNSILPKNRIINLYIPEVRGREKRKTRDSRAGLLGVEGIPADLLYSLLLPYAVQDDDECGTAPKKAGNDNRPITKQDFYEDGLSGGSGSSARRKALCRMASLPENISAGALLEALNLLYTYREYREMLARLSDNSSQQNSQEMP